MLAIMSTNKFDWCRYLQNVVIRVHIVNEIVKFVLTIIQRS